MLVLVPEINAKILALKDDRATEAADAAEVPPASVRSTRLRLQRFTPLRSIPVIA
jgi:hypothetical protein